MSDRRWGRLTALTRQITRHAHDITETLTTLDTHSDIDIRRPEKVGRSTSVSRPTEARMVEVDGFARDMAMRLLVILAGNLPLDHEWADNDTRASYARLSEKLHLAGPVMSQALAETAEELSGPVVVDWPALVDEVQGGMPLAVNSAWRRAVHQLCDLYVQGCSEIEDGWKALWDARRVCESCREPQCRLGCKGGSLVEDEGVDADLTTLLGQVRQVESRLFGLLRRVSPGGLRSCRSCWRPVVEGEVCGGCLEGRCRGGCGRRVSGTCGACRQRAYRRRRGVA